MSISLTNVCPKHFQAIDQGIGGTDQDMTVQATTSVQQEAAYSVTASDPGEDENPPVVIAGSSETTRTTTETLTKPAGKQASSKTRSAMQRYADMEETLPEFSSSSTSSSDSSEKQRQAKKTEEKRRSDKADITKRILAGMGPPSAAAWKAHVSNHSQM